jgi:hypothetical protein
MKKMTLVSICLLLLASATGIFAFETTTILFDRGLPTANLNNIAGVDRSNVAWADFESSIDPKTKYPVEYWVPGDDFTISKPGKYEIRTIRVWIVGDEIAPSLTTVQNTGGQTRLTLWGGTVSSGIKAISNKYSLTPVAYGNFTGYQGNSELFRQIYQVDFCVAFDLNGGETFSFFVDGPWKPVSGGYVNVYLHASNRLLSGFEQEGANDWFLWLHREGQITGGIDFWDSGTGEGTLCLPDAPCPGWDKASDANVQVFGKIKKAKK